MVVFLGPGRASLEEMKPPQGAAAWYAPWLSKLRKFYARDKNGQTMSSVEAGRHVATGEARAIGTKCPQLPRLYKKLATSMTMYA